MASELTSLEMSFVSPHLATAWSQKGLEQSDWARACGKACNELAAYISAIREGVVLLPDDVSLIEHLYEKAAEKRASIAEELEHKGAFGVARSAIDSDTYHPEEDLYTLMAITGTYATQYPEVVTRIKHLATLDGEEAAPGLVWSVDESNENGLSFTTVQLQTEDGQALETLQYATIATPGKTLSDFSDQLAEHDKFKSLLNDPRIGDSFGQQREAVVIIHAPNNTISLLLEHAKEAADCAVMGAADKDTIGHAIEEVTWSLGIAAPLQRGSASTTDILVKALKQANGIEVEPPQTSKLNWDLDAMLSPTAEDFITRGTPIVPSEQGRLDNSPTEEMSYKEQLEHLRVRHFGPEHRDELLIAARKFSEAGVTPQDGDVAAQPGGKPPGQSTSPRLS